MLSIRNQINSVYYYILCNEHFWISFRGELIVRVTNQCRSSGRSHDTWAHLLSAYTDLDSSRTIYVSHNFRRDGNLLRSVRSLYSRKDCFESLWRDRWFYCRQLFPSLQWSIYYGSTRAILFINIPYKYFCNNICIDWILLSMLINMIN